MLPEDWLIIVVLREIALPVVNVNYRGWDVDGNYASTITAKSQGLGYRHHHAPAPAWENFLVRGRQGPFFKKDALNP